VRYFRVRNLEEHQHYKNRRPPWVKLHAALLDDYDFLSLQDASKAHAMLLWLVASKLDNRIPYDAAYLTKMLGATTEVDLEALLRHRFIELLPEDASEPLAGRSQDAMPESEADVEREAETETTSTTTVEAVDELCRRMIVAANQGMAENPAIGGNALRPIPFGHGASHQAAIEIQRAGVDAAFASSIVFEMARTMKPAGRNRQIGSLGYCTARVIEQWESHLALSAANGAPRPAERTRTNSRRAARASVAEEGYLNAKIALQDYPE
jgi:hypothetical protein